MEKFGGIENIYAQNNNQAETETNEEKKKELSEKIKTLSKGAQKIAMVLFGLAATSNMASAAAEEIQSELKSHGPELQKQYEEQKKNIDNSKEEFFNSVAEKLGFSVDELSPVYTEEIEYGDYQENAKEEGEMKNENICVANFGSNYAAEAQDEEAANIYSQMGLKTVFYDIKEGVKINETGSYQVETTGIDEKEAILNGVRESVAFTGQDITDERGPSHRSTENRMGSYLIDEYSNTITMSSANCISSYEVLEKEDLPDGGKKIRLKVNFGHRAENIEKN